MVDTVKCSNGLCGWLPRSKGQMRHFVPFQKRSCVRPACRSCRRCWPTGERRVLSSPRYRPGGGTASARARPRPVGERRKAGQILGAVGMPKRLQQGRADARNMSTARQPLCDQGRVFQRPDPYRQDKPLFEEIDAPVAQVEIEAYLWVGL